MTRHSNANQNALHALCRGAFAGAFGGHRSLANGKSSKCSPCNAFHCQWSESQSMQHPGEGSA